MPFLVTKSGADGLTYKQTRRSEFHVVTRGARTTSTEWLDKVRAHALVLPAGAVFSHQTAAAIQDLPLPVRVEAPLHVTTPYGSPRIRRKGVKEHHRQLAPEEADRWHALPVTTPLRTLRDLAADLEVNDLVVIADHLLHRKLCSLEALGAYTGLRHGKVLAKVAQLAEVNSWSPEETRLRLTLAEGGLPKPTLNEHIIEDGTWIGCGDLVWRQWRTIADYDGDHHKTPQQRHQDSQTRDDYTATGWRHIAITSKMRNHERVDRVSRALKENGWNG